jgi:hypothetical protein
VSAEVLREAADSLRNEWVDADPGVRPTAFMLAVADWLDATADQWERTDAFRIADQRYATVSTWAGPPANDPALTVARAHLGERA